MDKAAQFNRRSKQLNVALTPLGSICKFVGILQDTFQPTEPGILAQHLPLISGRRSLLNAEAKGSAYRLNVVTHGL